MRLENVNGDAIDWLIDALYDVIEAKRACKAVLTPSDRDETEDNYFNPRSYFVAAVDNILDPLKEPDMPTLRFEVLIDTERRVSPARLAKALARAIEHTLDSDIAGAEALNRGVVGQVTVQPILTGFENS